MANPKDSQSRGFESRSSETKWRARRGELGCLFESTQCAFEPSERRVARNWPDDCRWRTRKTRRVVVSNPGVARRSGAPGGVSLDAFSKALNVLSNQVNAKLLATWPDRRRRRTRK